ncbi:conjugal transfer protein TraX [Patescibacteria group bacterium]|nr:conjugal transfer protein TraX [Patescibacteria group bacterium]
MSVFTIKIIAIITMVIDHTGVFLYPENMIFRIIGRLSFPLFAWLVANGAKHTKNINKYLGRLFFFGVLSQLPFMLPNLIIEDRFFKLNIMFTLLLGLLCIKILKLNLNKNVRIIFILLILAIAMTLKVSYGAAGIVSILFFYIYFDRPKKILVSQILIYSVLWFLQLSIQSGEIIYFSIQPLAISSLLIISSYNHKPGPKVKYLFYVFYPFHYLVFYFLLLFIK